MEQIRLEFGNDRLLGQVGAVLVEHFEVKEQLVVALGVDVLALGVGVEEAGESRAQASLLADLEEPLNELSLVADGVSLSLGGGDHVGVDVHGLGLAAGVPRLVHLLVLVVFPLADLLDLAHHLGLAGVEGDNIVDEVILHGGADMLIVDAHEDGTDVGVSSCYLLEVGIVEVDTLYGIVDQNPLAVLHLVSEVTQGDQAEVTLGLGVRHEQREARHFCIELDLYAHGRAILHGLDDIEQVELLEVRKGEDAEASEIVDALDSVLAVFEYLPLVLCLIRQESCCTLSSRIVKCFPSS